MVGDHQLDVGQARRRQRSHTGLRPERFPEVTGAVNRYAGASKSSNRPRKLSECLRPWKRVGNAELLHCIGYG